MTCDFAITAKGANYPSNETLDESAHLRENPSTVSRPPGRMVHPIMNGQCSRYLALVGALFRAPDPGRSKERRDNPRFPSPELALPRPDVS